MLKFQDELLNYIDSTELNRLPHTICMLGYKGCGKHTLATYMSERYNLDLVDLTKNITLDSLMEISESGVQKFYLIDADKISEKEQSTLLKFIEEPTIYAYMLILCSNEYTLLPTVLNRCYSFRFKPYSVDELKEFTDNSEIISLSNTPGDIIELSNNSNINDMINLSNKIFDCIKGASLGNCLVLPNKLKCNDNENGYDADLFFRVLTKVSAKRDLNTYLLTNKLYSNSLIPNVDKKKLFENYLIYLKEL